MFASLLEKLLPLVGVAIRHGLTAIGGGLFLSSDQVTSVSGAVMTLIGVALAAYKSHTDSKAVAAQPQA